MQACCPVRNYLCLNGVKPDGNRHVAKLLHAMTAALRWFLLHREFLTTGVGELLTVTAIAVSVNPAGGIPLAAPRDRGN